MFLPVGCRRKFLGGSREPGPWQTGPPPSHTHGPQDVWDKPPWEHQHRRGRGRWCPRHPWDPRPFPGPADFHGNEEGRWAPHDCPPSPSWDDREDRGGPEDFFREGWHRPGPWDPRPLPGPADFHGNEEDRRWATHNHAPPPPWDDREDNQGPEEYFGEVWDQPGPWDPGHFPGLADFHGNEEDRRWAPHDRHPPPHWNDREDNQGPVDCFGEGWHWEPWSGPSCSTWSEFPGEEQHPLCPPASVPGEGGGFPDGCPPWGYRGLGVKRSRRLRRGHRELTLVQRLPCSWSSRGNQPFCKSFHSLPGTSQPGVKEQQRSASPQSLMSCKGGVLNGKQTAQGPPAASKKVPEPPRPASSPQKSPATDSRAATGAAEPEQAAEATSVEPGARQKPAGSHSQVETALETEPAPPEKSPAGTGEQLAVEPCSPSVSKAGAGGGSHPQSPTAPPEPAEKVHAAAGSAGEAGAELCLCSGAEQQLQNGAEEAKGEAACDELLGVLQPSDNSQVLPGATVEPDAQPSQACPDICAAPETSPGTQHLPGSGETEPAADSQHQLCSTLPTPSPASTDLRSAAVLARKEEIELSYQQFSLTIAVVATMLLQKEPSMEAALGLALRANLRQGRIHHLQELEDFIDSYDSATLSR
ncbi:basic proline-rich protein-like isoform X7 [Accipiter gentilis]|uniref:basic proline-rich protein-like isoform X7 n=1 Tax=Astur gentilis TaxID=8957 RepID=UPI00211001A9|nr:basic proline-rich protein-like isoform X7 [Accipiter gentilis]